MKQYIHFLTILLLISFATSCTNDKLEDIGAGQLEYIIFGHFYGFCVGEACIEIFKLENGRVYEDTLDIYPRFDKPYEGNYVPLSQTHYNLVKDLPDLIPAELFLETEIVLGLPDATDGGGFYIEVQYKDDASKSGFWILDQSEFYLPEQYHSFVDEIKARILLLQP